MEAIPLLGSVLFSLVTSYFVLGTVWFFSKPIREQFEEGVVVFVFRLGLVVPLIFAVVSLLQVIPALNQEEGDGLEYAEPDQDFVPPGESSIEAANETALTEPGLLIDKELEESREKSRKEYEAFLNSIEVP